MRSNEDDGRLGCQVRHLDLVKLAIPDTHTPQGQTVTSLPSSAACLPHSLLGMDEYAGLPVPILLQERAGRRHLPPPPTQQSQPSASRSEGRGSHSMRVGPNRGECSRVRGRCRAGRRAPAATASPLAPSSGSRYAAPAASTTTTSQPSTAGSVSQTLPPLPAPPSPPLPAVPPTPLSLLPAPHGATVVPTYLADGIECSAVLEPLLLPRHLHATIREQRRRRIPATPQPPYHLSRPTGQRERRGALAVLPT